MNKIFKIVSFIGSFNNGMSENIVLYLERNITSLLAESVDIKNYKNSNIEYCRGCKNCFTSGKCIIINDDINMIKSDIINCDLFIISTPVYAKSLSGLTKSLIDRVSSWMHLMPLSGKLCIIAVCTYNNGINEVATYLYEIMSFLGLTVIGIITFSKDHSEESLKAQSDIIINYLSRLLKKEYNCDSNRILEEKYKAYDLVYQNMISNGVKNVELDKWIEQGYLGKKDFEEIIKLKNGQC